MKHTLMKYLLIDAILIMLAFIFIVGCTKYTPNEMIDIALQYNPESVWIDDTGTQIIILVDGNLVSVSTWSDFMKLYTSKYYRKVNIVKAGK